MYLEVQLIQRVDCLLLLAPNPSLDDYRNWQDNFSHLLTGWIKKCPTNLMMVENYKASFFCDSDKRNLKLNSLLVRQQLDQTFRS